MGSVKCYEFQRVGDNGGIGIRIVRVFLGSGRNRYPVPFYGCIDVRSLFAIGRKPLKFGSGLDESLSALKYFHLSI